MAYMPASCRIKRLAWFLFFVEIYSLLRTRIAVPVNRETAMLSNFVYQVLRTSTYPYYSQYIMLLGSSGSSSSSSSGGSDVQIDL